MDLSENITPKDKICDFFMKNGEQYVLDRTLAKVSGDNVLVKDCNAKIKAYRAKYDKICKATGFTPEYNRMTITRNSDKLFTNQQNGGIIKVLPKYETAEISSTKFTEYALDPLKDKNKTEAFKKALGYTKENVNDLVYNIRTNIKNFEAIEKPDNGYGKRYEVIMKITGANGKTANVATAWIEDSKTGITRLTSAYVTKKKTKGE